VLVVGGGVLARGMVCWCEALAEVVGGPDVVVPSGTDTLRGRLGISVGGHAVS
jgi:hypothetical protein